MQLIMSGNPNIDAIKSAVYFSSKHYKNKIDRILFVDNEGSLIDRTGQPIESKRNAIVRSYINNPSIESIMIERKDFHHEIPRILSEKLQVYGRSNIIVDLTNGDKFISSALYASASLSKIENLFFLSVDFEKRKENPEDLKANDYRIDVISPLENLESIGKHSFFEIIYYKSKIKEIVRMFDKAEFESSFLTNSFSDQLNNGISNYFLGKYPETINSIGQLSEEISFELARSISRIAKSEIKQRLPERNFDSSIQWLRAQFCDPLRGKKNQGLLEYEEQLKELQSIDKLADTIRVHRNFGSHAYDCLRGKEEAQLVLSTAFYFLSRIGESGVFSI